MSESFTTRQLAVIASSNKVITWLFRVIDNLGTVYNWSTGTVPAGNGSVNIGAIETPGTWTNGEWNVAHTFKITNFNGITLRRNKSESGIHAPNDVSFTIVNSSNTLAASNFKGGTVRIALVADDGLGAEIIGSWRFIIKSASPYNQQIDVTCEDFLQQYLKGTYPNTRSISEIFPANTDNKIINDNVCVPEPYGTAYIPLRSIYASSARYYLLGPSTGKTYTISEVRNPRATGAKLTWTSPTFAMTQSTKTAPDTSSWQVFQPIIAASTGGGAVDSPGLWQNGDTFWDIPTKFSEAGTVSLTGPADVIRRVMLNMGLSDLDLNGPSFDTARTTFASWGLTWNFAFFYKQDRSKVLSRLLAMCHCCLVVGERVSLQVLSATSVKTLTDAEVTKPSEEAPSSFRYTDSLAEKVSDSGYAAWQQTGESQDLFLKILVPAKSATDYPDSETIEFPGVQDSQKVQKLGTLYYQRKLLKSADISASLKGTCLIIRPDDVTTVNYADFGGTYNVLIDEVTIKPDASMDIRAIKFSEVLDDWADLSPAAITVATDSTTNTYSPVYAGPDSPGSTNLPNALPGRLRIGQTANYILLDPVNPLRISLYSADTERVRLGNLNGYLDYVTNLYGIAIGDVSNYLKYDPTNGLRISGALSAGTISIGTSPNWFKVDASGNMWLGQDTLANAQANTFAVTNAGVLNAITGYLGGSTNGWQIAAGTITSLGTGKIQTAASGARCVLDSSGLAIYDATTQRAKIGSDGAGWLGASTTIAWTSAGVVTVAGFTTGTADLTKTSGGNTTIVSSGATAFTAGPTGAPTFTVTQVGALVATSATITGIITANTGYIGGASGWTISSKTITGAADSKLISGLLESSNWGLGAGSQIDLVNQTMKFGGSSAPKFSVAADGALSATGATISGAITATSGTFTGTVNATAGYFGDGATRVAIEAGGLNIGNTGSIRGGQTAYNTGTGFFLGYSGAYKFSIGNPAGNYMTWDGSTLTYTKGTLVETIIQMYTSVASLKTSATAGDGSASSAGMVVTYEGLFGCGANQTATIAAANANVRILATGAAFFTGSVTITGGSGYANLSDKPSSLSGINSGEGTKLSGIEAGADVTSTHTASNTSNVGAIAASSVAGWAHTSDTTKIDGGDIYTGSVTANKITVTNLAALNADMGSITAGSIVIGTTNKLWLNDSADGALNIGGATKASAPFRVTAAGALVATSATITGDITASTGYFQTVTLGKTGVASGTLTLQINDTAGDTYINSGKTDYTNTDAGFILGLDDSDSNKAKFYIGSSTKYFNWDGASITILGDIKTAASGERLEFLTADNKLHFYNSGGTETVVIGASSLGGYTANISAINTSTGNLGTTNAIVGGRSGSTDCTSNYGYNYGLWGFATSTKSAGAYNLINIGSGGFASGADINIGIFADYTISGGQGGGPLCLRADGSASAPTHSSWLGTLWVTSAGVLYINTDGGTTWGKVGAQ